jgi:hypothetical protein
MRAVAALLFGASLLLGCATSPEAPSFAVAPIPQLAPDTAVLYIYRVRTLPSGMSAYLEIDEKEVASLANEGFTWVYVQPGKRQFKFGWPLLAAMPSVKFERTFEGGKVYAFEMVSSISGGPTIWNTASVIKPLDIESATQVMKSCCRYVKPTGATF